jgi:hypothetical protein
VGKWQVMEGRGPRWGSWRVRGGQGDLLQNVDIEGEGLTEEPRQVWTWRVRVGLGDRCVCGELGAGRGPSCGCGG